MIEVEELSRRYGDFWAVDGVSFTVNEREIVGILGPNGAGKTTTIRMITGFVPPSSGRVAVNTRDMARSSVAARREIGYLPENVALYPEMRVGEYLGYRARLEGLARPDARRRIGVALERCLLAEVENQIIGTLSKGYRQRVGLATAILHDPAVLVLDEPTVGLDPRQIVAIRELIRELGTERTLLLSTHILPEVELLCDRVIIFDGGRIVAQGTPGELQDSWSGASRVEVELKHGDAEIVATLESISGVSRASADESGRLVTLECAGNEDPREAVFRAAVERGWTLLGLRRSRASLEDVFVRLTTREQGVQAEPGDGGKEVTS
jgi:ABC-2 type transport system ATP-binding protein